MNALIGISIEHKKEIDKEIKEIVSRDILDKLKNGYDFNTIKNIPKTSVKSKG